MEGCGCWGPHVLRHGSRKKEAVGCLQLSRQEKEVTVCRRSEGIIIAHCKAKLEIIKQDEVNGI